MERILIIRYSALGDVVLATSLLAPLRDRFPRAQIEWVTSAACAPLVEGLPGISAVHRLGRGPEDGALALARRLRGRFDVAVDLQGKLKSALIARAAAPRRVTFARRTTAEALRALLGHDRPLVRAHATALYAEALRPLGVAAPGRTIVEPSGEARRRAGALLGGLPRPLVALAPGATWATKRWDPRRLAEVGDALHGDGCALVLCAGPGDAAASATLRAALRAPLAADLTPLDVGGLAAALGEVSLLVTNDTGPAHLAGAVGTPALVVFGPTSPIRWGPAPPGRAISLGLDCQPCSNHGGERCPLGHHRCLAELPAATVLAAARELLR